MTKVGQSILQIYSLLIVTGLITADIKKIIKRDRGGWITIFLIPVFVLLINTVWRR